MLTIKQIYDEHIAKNPIDNVILEIILAQRIDKNCLSYELTGSKFNEILADISLLKIWTEWKSGYSTKYFLNDMTMILDEQGHSRVSINKTLFQKFLEHDQVVIPLSGSQYLKHLPQITDIRIHRDDIKGINSSNSGNNGDEIGSVGNTPFLTATNPIQGIGDDNDEVSGTLDDSEKTYSNLHVKCCRKIPLSITNFPPYDEYHAIERIAFRYYHNAELTVNFMISRPRDCLRGFDELLVNWQNSRFMIKIVVHSPGPLLAALLQYLGWH